MDNNEKYELYKELIGDLKELMLTQKELEHHDWAVGVSLAMAYIAGKKDSLTMD